MTHEQGVGAIESGSPASWRILSVLLFTTVFAGAQQITTTGLTGTTVSIDGRTTTVTTTTVIAGTAFNSFGNFNVYTGNAVGLVVPKGATNLVNVITNGASSINGLLTSSNQEAGVISHVFFVQPSGLLIGGNSTVDMDGVTMVTATASWTAGFFTASNQPNPSAVNALLDGTAPLYPMGYVIHAGFVSARASLCLRANRVVAKGMLMASAGEGAELKDGHIRIEAVQEALFSDGAKLIANRGGISILCSTNLSLNRTLLAASGDVLLQATAQDIVITNSSSVHAGGNVTLKAGGQTMVSANSSIVAQQLQGAPYPTVRLVPGWNLVSYNSALASPVTNVLAAIKGKYSMVCAYTTADWRFYDPTNTVGSTLTTFEPGNAYWINATEAATLPLP